MTELAPSDLAAIDPTLWATMNRIRLMSGEFSFKDHQYQMEPMQGRGIDGKWARRVCYMKATQGGFTEIEVLKTLHGLIYRRYPQGVLYLFPTTDDVGEFSKSRFGPLIEANKNSIKRFVKSGGRGTDTTSLKKIHDAFLFLRGARLPQSIEGGLDKESSKLRSVPVDRVVFDELDLMDEDAIPKALARMGHSRVQEECYISNPTIPGRGIDKMFKKSDQRHWHRKCACGTWMCAEESFPDCVQVGEDGRGYIACPKCGKPVPVYAGKGTGEWVAKKPEVKDFPGYRWSQLSSVFNDPAKILAEFNDPANPNLGDTYRLRLGLPYIPKEDQLTEGQVYDCCANDAMLQHHAGPCAMGVDIGREFHVVIGIRTARDRFEILRLTRVPCAASAVRMDEAWARVHDLARAFNVRSAVVDIRPYEHSARRFRAEEPYRVLLAEYTENALVDCAVNSDTGIIKSYRTGLCDTTHRLITEKRVTLPRRCPEVDLFTEQVIAMAKILEKDKRTGVSKFRYTNSDPDHYRHALGYFSLAAAKSSVVHSGPRRNRQAVARNRFALK